MLPVDETHIVSNESLKAQRVSVSHSLKFLSDIMVSSI